MPGRRGRTIAACFALAVVAAGHAVVSAAEPDEARNLFRAGKYAECERLAAEQIGKGFESAEWWQWKIRSETARGRYDDANRSVEAALARHRFDLTTLLLAHDVYRAGGRAKEAAPLREAIDSRGARTPAERVALGRYLLARGADAKEVLDRHLNPVIASTPAFVDAHLAVAELALAKNDRAFASDALRRAPKDAARDPYFHFLTARTFAYDDPKKSRQAIADALAVNPHHADSLLLRADQLIDADDYSAAEAAIKTVLEVDPDEPRAWAYRAVVAHLRADAAGERAAVDSALKRWPSDPQVEHLVGRKLSQDYRFREGAAYQRKALAKDAAFLPAKAQLSQDLLRLGEEAEGWKLAAEVFAADGYDVVAHNLVTLRDHIAGYRTIAADGFVLRMDPREADVYGARALAVLTRARKTLAAKYGVQIDGPVTVEIFPRKQDFAVRTFGLPGADGFLGVCFGPVITVNSPAAQGKDPSNWEAVLWHEFCHTVTLHKTANKLPRWLSEGISVYEELQENPGWGQWMTPKYREMILGDDLTPMSRLTSAFMDAKTPQHVQFAYYESALAVEFLVRRYGFEAFKALLDDVRAGVPVNEALERRGGGSLAALDRDFAAFARDRARATAADATWEKPDLPDAADAAALRDWLQAHPKSFPGLLRLGRRLVKEEKWADAEVTLRQVRDLYPEYVAGDNAYESLAAVYRKTRDTAREKAILEAYAARSGDAVSAYQRLIELGENEQDWPAVVRNARRWLAVNPLTPAPHRALAKGAEATGDRAEALAAYRAVLRCGVPDAADVRFRIAVLLDQAGERVQARREVLMSLEDAPRSRDALELLLKLADPTAAPPPREKTP